MHYLLERSEVLVLLSYGENRQNKHLLQGILAEVGEVDGQDDVQVLPTEPKDCAAEHTESNTA